MRRSDASVDAEAGPSGAGGGFRSGFVSITGKPNVGKSTFLNAVLGQKVSIVARKAQTTRNRILGIKTTASAQVIFVDTPGIHRPKNELGSSMVKQAVLAVRDVDVVLFMVEPAPPSAADRDVIRVLRDAGKPVILLINKTDKVKKPLLLPVIEAYRGLYDFREVIPVSALKGQGLDLAVSKAVELLPPGPKLYPEDMVTDSPERFMVAEIIREKVIRQTGREVPHSTAVEVESWRESKGMVSIKAVIYVEKEGQKGIIIGKDGGMLKGIGSAARVDIEELLGSKVFLGLWVKVRGKWRSNRALLGELGY